MKQKKRQNYNSENTQIMNTLKFLDLYYCAIIALGMMLVFKCAKGIFQVSNIFETLDINSNNM